MVSRISPGSMPDELYFLCMLYNIGATTVEKSLTLQEISHWTSIENEKVKENLRKLMGGNYIQSSLISGVHRYFLTIDGIRNVLSMYS